MISLIVPEAETKILTVTKNGYGKRTSTDEFPRKGRGGQGVIGMQLSERNGDLVGAVQVSDTDEVMLISNGGVLVRVAADSISEIGRNTQGVRVIRLRGEEQLIACERVADQDEPESSEDLDSEATE